MVTKLIKSTFSDGPPQRRTVQQPRPVLLLRSTVRHDPGLHGESSGDGQ